MVVRSASRASLGHEELVMYPDGMVHADMRAWHDVIQALLRQHQDYHRYLQSLQPQVQVQLQPQVQYAYNATRPVHVVNYPHHHPHHHHNHHRRHHHHNGDVGLAVAGGLVAGAMLGAVLS